jgi:flagellar protein FliL
MSENETEDQTTESTEPVVVKKKKGKKLIIIALVVVVLIGAGGGGFFYWRKASAAALENQAKKDTEKAQPEQKAEKKADDALGNALPDDSDVKKIVELPPFIVNLADSEQARYLRMTISLGVNGGEAANEKPDQLFMTRVRNAILAVVSEKKSSDILSVEGKTKLRKELLMAAQAASEEPKVLAIYITDFIVQL